MKKSLQNMQKMLNEWEVRGQKKQLKKSVLNIHKLPIKSAKPRKRNSVQNVPKMSIIRMIMAKQIAVEKWTEQTKNAHQIRDQEKKMNGWKKVYWMCKKKYRVNQEEKGKTNK